MFGLIKKMFWMMSFFIFSAGNLFAEEVQYSDSGVTFSQLLRAGGWVMAFIILISIVMLGLSIFCFFWLRSQRFIP